MLAVSLSVELTAEVQILDDGNVETVAQSSAIISRDLIVGSSIAPQLGFSIVPITAGGTGETSAAAAVTALGLPAAANIATLSGTQTFTGSKAFVGNTFPIGTFERETGAATTGIFGATGLRASSTGVLADGFGPLFVAQIKGSGMGSFSGIGQIGFVRAGADNTGDIIFQPLAAGVATTRLLVRATGNVWLRNSLEFEGSTLDANKTTLTVTDPTASNTITLPNASGTVGLVLSGTATIDFASVNSGNWSTTETITVTGAATGDSVSLGLPTAAGTEDIIFTAWVSAADTVSIKFHNANGGSVNLASLAYKATIIR